MQRKHRKQMTVAEIKAVESLLRSVTSWVSKGHYETRSRERSITRLEVYRAIATGAVIEAKDDSRLVVRGADGVCVVCEIPTHRVITAWYNAPDDQHWTLDLSQYRWQVNLTQWSAQCKTSMK